MNEIKGFAIRDFAGHELGESSVKLHFPNQHSQFYEATFHYKGKALARIEFNTIQQIADFERILQQGFAIVPYSRLSR